METYLEVAFNVPLSKRFVYLDLENSATKVGMRVVAPFRRRLMTGYVVGLREHPPEDVHLRTIKRCVDKQPVFDAKLVGLAEWVADTYLCGIGEALAAIVPSGRREKTYRDHGKETENVRQFELTKEQQFAVNALTVHLRGNSSDSCGRKKHFYLRGVTGSGKTAVFLATARQLVATGQSVIYLVPEISLTHQVVDQFRNSFGSQIAVIHSALTPSQRLKEWSRIIKGTARIVIGARSAVFAPVKNLGLIVLDEEHEASYKAGSTPRYHARQVAMHRCSQEGAILVMGSATPSLEALHHIKNGRLQCIKLTRRPGRGSMPLVELIDMKNEDGPLSNRLIDELRLTARAGRQSIVFLNRRGFAYFFHCKSCGHEMSCTNCSTSLTYHKASHRMICHYCGFQTKPINVCPACSSLDVGYRGYGTQRVEEEILGALPELRVRRLDTDVTRDRDELRRVLLEFRKGSIDVLVGTQMVAKGLDFPAVRLVGIVNADSSLRLPDFRAAERTFNLLVQVSGRAGRALPDGRVLVQTYLPDQYPIQFAVEGRIEEFYERETNMRQKLGFPPYTRLIRVVFRSRSQQNAITAANNFAYELERQRLDRNIGEILGPAQCAIERIAGNYRIHLLLRHGRLGPIHQWVKQTYSKFKTPTGVYVELDIDPVSIM